MRFRNFPSFERQPTYCKIDKIDNIIWKPVLQTFSLFGRIIALLWFETWVMIRFSWSLSDSIWVTPPARDRSHIFCHDVLRFRPRGSVLRWHITRGHVINYWKLARAAWRFVEGAIIDIQDLPESARARMGSRSRCRYICFSSPGILRSQMLFFFSFYFPTVCISGIRKQQFICGHLYNNS